MRFLSGGGQESAMQQRKVVGHVTAEERDELRELELRKTGLAELFLALACLDSAALEASPSYDRLVRDMGQVTNELRGWWDAKAELYGWERQLGGGWTLDLETCEVLVAES
jgi:CXXX repeat modification system protein